MIPLPKIVVSLDNEELFTQKQDIPRQVTAQLHYEKAKSIQWQDRFRTIPHPYGLDPLINPNDQYWQAFEATWNSEVPAQLYCPLTHPTHVSHLRASFKLIQYPEMPQKLLK